MYAGRLILGLGTGCITVVVPLYIAELAPPSIRGSLVGLYEINNQLSSLTAFWCNYIVKLHISDTSSAQWRIPLGVQLIPSALLLLASLFLIPESPRFLLKCGNAEKARAVLAYVRHLPPGHEYIEGEMREIEMAVGREGLGGSKSAGGCDTEKTGKWYQCKGMNLSMARELWWKGNRERVVIGVCLMFGQNLTGTMALNFYLPTIFRSIGLRGTNEILLASGFFSVVKCVFTLTSLAIFIDRLGRRLLLIVASVGSAFALWYIGTYVMIAKVDLLSQVEGISTQGWVAIVMVYVYAAFYSIAWNGVVWVYCAEIFPTRIKELAVCLTTAAQWMSQFLVARASPSMLSSLKGGFFFFFAACITLMGIGVYFFVPETKGRTCMCFSLYRFLFSSLFFYIL
ncbi:Quinate permease protein [Rutstroemia sp. NJR-2017a BBW]|nr:Quinate permease protein [Rutstroemia sp. NJR-2017a BBW]